MQRRLDRVRFVLTWASTRMAQWEKAQHSNLPENWSDVVQELSTSVHWMGHEDKIRHKQ